MFGRDPLGEGVRRMLRLKNEKSSKVQSWLQ